MGSPHKHHNGVVLHERAAENLKFIRSTMERAGSFTAVPGAGGMLMGVTALAAAWLASQQPDAAAWLRVWGAALIAAVAIGAVAMRRKAVRVNIPLAGVMGRRFALSFGAPLAAGAILTGALYWRGEAALLPAVWLTCYGAAVVAGGTMSVLPVPLMGGAMIVLGMAAAVVPAWGDVWLGAGFGVLQVVFGVWIARRYGG